MSWRKTFDVMLSADSLEFSSVCALV